MNARFYLHPIKTMKTFHRTALAVLALLLLTGLPATANLIQATDPGFGPNSLTVDTASGLAWLDLPASAGLTYNQVLADTQAGGIFSGFAVATAQQVLNLYLDAGIPGTGDYALSTPAIPPLLSLLGPTEMVNGLPGLIGMSATTDISGAQDAPAIYPVGGNGVEVYTVNGGGPEFGGGTAYGDTISYPELGTWLVANVPESPDASIYALATAGLTGFKYLLRRARTR